MSYNTFDDYFWEGQNCMRNILGIHNQIELDDAVYSFAYARTIEIEKIGLPAPSFDGEGLKAMHKHLFQDCYEWAGEYRECPMGRNMQYAEPGDIAPRIAELCSEFKRDFLDAKFENTSAMGDSLADYWARLNAIHPFRDGNGRSQFAFFDAACRSKGFELDISAKDIRNLRLARDAASEGQPRLLAAILGRSLAVCDEDLAARNIGVEDEPEPAPVPEKSAATAAVPEKKGLFAKLKSMISGSDSGRDRDRSDSDGYDGR